MLKWFKNFFIKHSLEQVSSPFFLGQKNILLYFDDCVCFKNSVRQTKYFKNIANFLVNKNLHSLLYQNRVKLFVRAPYIGSAWKGRFPVSNISFVDDKFIKQSKEYMQMLITDSSVLSLEFIASDRPIIFYNLCRKKNPKVPQLYNVSESIDKLLTLLSYYVENDFKLQKEYKEKNFLFLSSLQKENKKTIL